MTDQSRWDEAVATVPILEAMGIRIVEARPGFAAAELPPEPNVNHFGVTYAGSLFSVAEMLGGVLSLVCFELEAVLTDASGEVVATTVGTYQIRRF